MSLAVTRSSLFDEVEILLASRERRTYRKVIERERGGGGCGDVAATSLRGFRDARWVVLTF